MVANNSTTINFSSESTSQGFKFELDSEYNEEIYGENKAEFNKAETAYIRCVPPLSSLSYTLKSSIGTLKTCTKDLSMDVTENLVFAFEKSKSLSFVCSNPSEISCKFSGSSSVPPYLFADNKIVFEEIQFGVLEVTYSILYDRLSLSNVDFENDTCVVLTASIYGETTNTLQVSYVWGDADSIPVKLQIVVKDICTDAVISGAMITLTGINTTKIFSGITDATGLFIAEGVVPEENPIPGEKYDVAIVAGNYQPSISDNLNNDKLTVPSPPEPEEDEEV